MPEFTAPGLGRESNHVTIEADLGDDASGVLYALGGASGGLTLYMDKGQLVYEYNMMIIERYTASPKDKLPAGQHRIEVDTRIAKPGAPAEVILSVDGSEVARTTVDPHSPRRLHRQRDLRRGSGPRARRCHLTTPSAGPSPSTGPSTRFGCRSSSKH
ncbi:MAG: hypothetical protein V9F04_10750 [Dermatophilaceae bacterium]